MPTRGGGPAGELIGRDGADLRTVVCHLGAGASACAIRGGASVDTTIGFTPLEGLVMATRCDTVDPGLMLWLLRRRGLPANEVDAALEQRSGLLALASTADARAVVERAAAGDPNARLALDVYSHRLRAAIAAMAAALDGLDVLVFTGAVGERSPAIRAAATDRLRHLGVSVDPDHNIDADADTEVSTDGATVHTLVVRAREDVQIAREVRAVLRRP